MPAFLDCLNHGITSFRVDPNPDEDSARLSRFRSKDFVRSIVVMSGWAAASLSILVGLAVGKARFGAPLPLTAEPPYWFEVSFAIMLVIHLVVLLGLFLTVASIPGRKTLDRAQKWTLVGLGLLYFFGIAAVSEAFGIR